MYKLGGCPQALLSGGIMSSWAECRALHEASASVLSPAVSYRGVFLLRWGAAPGLI